MLFFVGFGALKGSNGIQVGLLISTVSGSLNQRTVTVGRDLKDGLVPSFFTMLSCVYTVASFSESLLRIVMCVSSLPVSSPPSDTLQLVCIASVLLTFQSS